MTSLTHKKIGLTMFMFFASYPLVTYYIELNNYLWQLAKNNDMLTDDGVAKNDEEEKKGPAIAILASNLDKDLRELRVALKSLDIFMKHDNLTTPVLLFNEGDLSQDQIDFVKNSTNRTIHFPLVDFQSFPEGFDPEKEECKVFKKRSKWGYQQMCRFWASLIWDHSILDNYSTFMRFDTDSCFTKSLDLTDHSYLPGLPDGKNGNFTYHYVGHNMFRDAPNVIEGFSDFVQDYVITNNITVKNPSIWESRVKQGHGVYNNFEVSDIAFFRRPDVMAFQKTITETKPWKMMTSRWGDANIRLATLAIFADEKEILLGKPDAYQHKGCVGKLEQLGIHMDQ